MTGRYQADARQRHGETLLHTAAKSAEAPVVEALLKDGADARARTELGTTPLHFAANHNRDPAAAKMLLAWGADVDARNLTQQTPLHLAAEFNDNSGVLKVLVHAGASLGAQNLRGDSPLHLAAASATVPETLKILLGGKEVDLQQRNQSGETPLHLAARDNTNPGVQEVLLKAGANVRVTAWDGSTPLHYAAGKNLNAEVVSALLIEGADVGVRRLDGSVPLHCAVAGNQNSRVLETLLVAGAELVSARNMEDETPWDLAEQRGKEDLPFGDSTAYRLLKFMSRLSDRIACSCPPGVLEAVQRAAGDEFQSPSDWLRSLVLAGAEAARDRRERERNTWKDASPENIPALLADRWSAQTVNERGETPLHLAARYCTDPRVLRTLMDVGADVMARTKEHEIWHHVGQATPLHYAAGYNPHPIVVRTLLQLGADVAACTKNGETPLHWAARYNRNPVIVMVLLDSGADLTTQTPRGETALDYANKTNAVALESRLRRKKNAL